MSGWIAILAVLLTLGLSTFIGKQVYDYKELQRKAAYCEGKMEALKNARAYQDRIIRSLEKESKEVIDEIEDLKSSEGCAREPAPPIILDKLRDVE